MIQSLTLTAGLLMAVLVQTGDPVTTETVPRQLISLDGAAAEAVIAQARAEVCGEGPCDYVFTNAAEIAGSMCWNDEEAAQLYCRGAVVGTQAEGCEPGPGGALYDCWTHEMMEGSVSAALTDDPRLATGELHWMSYDRGGDGVYDILESAYCAQPPEGACTRIYNIGVISRPDSDAYSLIFEHCWDDAEAGLARCRQAIIGVAGEN
ncbi:hypothetical protein [Maricaulis sp.]|uniref:hypothetical protein n=1 Tax=Maricaulis sp. TaxID=1486257 RepID=UPI002606BE0D|nr:hypothetical protein [Maricaulis sp.]